MFFDTRLPVKFCAMELPRMLTCAVHTIGYWFGTLVLLSCVYAGHGWDSLSWFPCWGWLSIACWGGFLAAELVLAAQIPGGLLSCHGSLPSPARLVGRVRVVGCRFGWKRRLSVRLHVSPGRQAALAPPPSPPCNGSFRGGGGSMELDLLKGLTDLLNRFDPTKDSQVEESGKGSFTPYPKSKGGSKGKGQSTKSFSPKQSFYDQPGKGSKGGIGADENGALLDALKRLVERASRNNGTGLIQRLHDLVDAAKNGKTLGSKKRKRKGKRTTQTPGSESQKGSPKGKGFKKGKGFQTGKGTGPQNSDKGKSFGKGKPQKAPLKNIGFQPVRLHPKGWPVGAAMSSEKLRSALENGQVPSGCVTWVRPDQILEFKTLAQTHNITKAYALVCLAESAQVTPHNQVVSSENSPLLTDRDLWDPTAWKALVTNPTDALRSVIPPHQFHSTFGWKSLTHKTKFGEKKMSSKVMSKLIRTVCTMSFENLGPGVCSFPKSLKKIQSL